MGKVIKLQNLTPEVFYRQSRDFQFIGRLFDVVLNNSKLNSNLLYNLPLNDDRNDQLMDLMALTLGFKSKHNYNIKQLSALCSSFVEIIKDKGSILAIKTACNVLLHAEGISDEAAIEVENYHINIFIPSSLSDLNLLKDLLLYILPAGMSCTIVREAKYLKEPATEIGVEEAVENYGTKLDYNLSIIPEISGTALTDKYAKDTAGLFINSSIVQIPITRKTENEDEVEKDEKETSK